MTLLRIGTRGSELALIQTRMVCQSLVRVDPTLRFEEVILKTHGDREAQAPFDIHWPAGGFTGAIEQALLGGEIDLAVHSYKDLPTAETPGLIVAAVPPREAVHDVLVSREAIDPKRLPRRLRIGTCSPRRAAQLRRFLSDVNVVPIRGNVPTRLEKLERGEYDAIVLAAAGLNRLGIKPAFYCELAVKAFVPAAAQGALAVQVRAGETPASIVAAISDLPTWRAVEGERAFLRGISAGCHTPVGALAVADGAVVRLHGQLFSDDGTRMVEGIESDPFPEAAGRRLADRLVRELHSS